MAVNKAFLYQLLDLQVGTYRISAIVGFLDTVNDQVIEVKNSLDIYLDSPIDVNDGSSFVDAINTKILNYASGQGYSITATDIIWPGVVNGRSFSQPSRSLNSSFQISTSRDVLVSYSVDIACTLSLTSGQQGTLYLEYADDSGFTTNVKEVGRYVNGNTGTLTIGLNLTQNATAPVGGIIPTAKYVRLRTQNNTGTPTFTFRSAQEVLL